MNLLIHKLPKTDKYGVPIKTSFRNWVNFELAMNDQTMQETDRILCGLSSVYDIKYLTNNIAKRIDGATEFLNGWHTQMNKTASTGERVLDFDIDAPQIFASFMMQYGINLTNAKLHWYEFMPLLINLSQETPMGYIMHIRGCKVEGTKEQKEIIRRQKNIYRIDYIEYNPEEIVKKYSKGAPNNG